MITLKKNFRVTKRVLIGVFLKQLEENDIFIHELITKVKSIVFGLWAWCVYFIKWEWGVMKICCEWEWAGIGMWFQCLLGKNKWKWECAGIPLMCLLDKINDNDNQFTKILIVLNNAIFIN